MLYSDLHVHTLMSGHGFCTINECIETAQKKGVSLIAITDHGPAMQHSAHEGYFEMSTRLQKHYNGVDVLFGCEMNILNRNGDVDLTNSVMSDLDIVLAGLHERTLYSNLGESENTMAIINAMKRHPNINIITHPYRAQFPVSILDVVQAAKEYHVLLEVNVSLLLKAIQEKTIKNNTFVIRETRKMIHSLQSIGYGYLINSDAHHTSEIGISDNVFNLLISELDICFDFVWNNKLDLLKQYIPSLATYKVDN